MGIGGAVDKGVPVIRPLYVKKSSIAGKENYRGPFHTSAFEHFGTCGGFAIGGEFEGVLRGPYF